jgi:hypothetical protein
MRHCQTLWLPKRGNTVEEYEDACAADPARGCFAIADGATESSYARSWAMLLAAEFVRSPAGGRPPWATWLPPLQQRWAAEIGDQPRSWFAEAKAAQGAFATFLGLVVVESRSIGQWHAVAVGDSCLFQIRSGSLHALFPIVRADDFGNTPALVGSRAHATELEGRGVLLATGDWQAGDRIYLMTDALAQWFLRQCEGGQRPWEQVEEVLTQTKGNAGLAAWFFKLLRAWKRPETDARRPAPFAVWIEGLWDSQELRNDDVTLVALRL